MRPPLGSKTKKIFILIIIAILLLNIAYYVMYNFRVIYQVINRRPTRNANAESKQSDSMASSDIIREDSSTSYYQTTSSTSVNEVTIKNKLSPSSAPALRLCPVIPIASAEFNFVSFPNMYLEAIDVQFGVVNPGGISQPIGCIARQKVAVIIPHRFCIGCNHNLGYTHNDTLPTFLNYMHTFLMDQQLDYQIFVIEQYDTTQPHNGGKLLNAGFIEAMKIRGNWDCLVFHSEYLLPKHLKNLYKCTKDPRNMISDEENKSLSNLSGGAYALTPTQFREINGFSNLRWGYEPVFQDVVDRFTAINRTIVKSRAGVGTYSSLEKMDSRPKPTRDITSMKASLFFLDGLSNIKYKRMSISYMDLYTQVLVDIGAPEQEVEPK